MPRKAARRGTTIFFQRIGFAIIKSSGFDSRPGRKKNNTNNKNMEALKTQYRLKKEARDLEIYNRWRSLTMNSESQRTAILDLIKAEFDIASYSAVYAAIHRVEKRANA